MPRLARTAGHQLASEMLFTGRPVTAKEAYERFGLYVSVKTNLSELLTDLVLQRK